MNAAKIHLSLTFQKFIKRKLIFHLAIFLVLLAILFTQTFLEVDDGSILLFLQQFLPCIFLLLPYIVTLYSIPGQVRKVKGLFSKTQQPPVVDSKRELDVYACEMIAPSLKHKIGTLNSIVFFLLLLPSVFFVAPFAAVVSENANHVIFWLAVSICGLQIVRYVILYRRCTNRFFEIQDDRVKLPQLKVFKKKELIIHLDDIDEVVVFGSLDNFAMTMDEDIDKRVNDLIDSGSIFMQGLCIFRKKKKPIILSSSLLPFQCLYEIQKKAEGNRMVLVREFG